jgi:hypothetical protein
MSRISEAMGISSAKRKDLLEIAQGAKETPYRGAMPL